MIPSFLAATCTFNSLIRQCLIIIMKSINVTRPIDRESQRHELSFYRGSLECGDGGRGCPLTKGETILTFLMLDRSNIILGT